MERSSKEASRWYVARVLLRDRVVRLTTWHARSLGHRHDHQTRRTQQRRQPGILDQHHRHRDQQRELQGPRPSVGGLHGYQRRPGTFSSVRYPSNSARSPRDSQNCATQWATETNAFVCSYVLKTDPEGKELSGSYYRGAAPIIQEQIAKGGVRLAVWLNQIFGSGQPGQLPFAAEKFIVQGRDL